MKSLSGYIPKKTLSLGCDKCLLPVPLFSGITENKKSANEHLTQTEGVLGLRTVEKRGILLEDLIHYNNE